MKTLNEPLRKRESLLEEGKPLSSPYVIQETQRDNLQTKLNDEDACKDNVRVGKILIDLQKHNRLKMVARYQRRLDVL